MSVQNNNNIRIWAIQLIQMADSSFQLVELVQMSNENGYIIQAVELAPLAMNEWIRFYCIQLSFQ